jgi:N-acetylglucosamine-6-phosphate deacetylase
MHNEYNTTQRILIAQKLYAPEEIAGPIAVVLQGTTIRDIWHNTDMHAARQRLREHTPGSSVEITDLGSWSLAPGYIDLHIHGFRGYDATTGTQTDITAMARELPHTGVTSFFPTIATTDRAKTIEQVQRIANAAENQQDASSAEILGLRLEGPFISRAKKGAQIVTFTGLPWSAAIGMATHIPARIAHLAPRKGTITPGADADLIALDTNGLVQRTWIRGHPTVV